MGRWFREAAAFVPWGQTTRSMWLSTAYVMLSRGFGSLVGEKLEYTDHLDE